MADPVGAIMLIVGVITSGTPSTTVDDTHVIMSPYATMEDCKAALARVPLSEAELQVERDLKLRVVRSCTVPWGEFWYGWKNGRVIGTTGTVVESGSYRDR